MNDKELHDAFRALAGQDARAASPFSRAHVDAKRPLVHARRQRRAWYAATGVAVAAAATLVFAVMPQRELLNLDLGGPVWAPSTDFLLNTPGSSLLRSVPSIGVTITSRKPAASRSRGDTSGRDK